MIKYLLLIALFTTSVSASVIYWTDNSDNETGFVIERRLSTKTKFTELTKVAKDSTYFVDNDSLSGNYCYRIGAFNRAGISYSDEKCKDLIRKPNSPGIDQICQQLKSTVAAFCANE